MKRKLAIVFGLMAVLSVISTGTLAYFTTTVTTDNVVTAGNMELEIHDKITDTDEDFSIEKAVMPGDVIGETVTVENTGGHPLYLRIKLTKGVNDENLTADNCLAMDIDTTVWEYREDNGEWYYYYKEVLGAGETTPPLFTEVRIVGTEVDNRYRGKDFKVNISAYAVQSENNGATVFDAFGWPETATAEQ